MAPPDPKNRLGEGLESLVDLSPDLKSDPRAPDGRTRVCDLSNVLKKIDPARVYDLKLLTLNVKRTVERAALRQGQLPLHPSHAPVQRRQTLQRSGCGINLGSALHLPLLEWARTDDLCVGRPSAPTGVLL